MEVLSVYSNLPQFTKVPTFDINKYFVTYVDLNRLDCSPIKNSQYCNVLTTTALEMYLTTLLQKL